MRSFSGYGFKRLEKREDLPKGSHYVGIVFGTRSEYSPPYDAKDTGSSYSVPEIKHYILKDKAELQAWVQEVAMSDSSYTFYFVKSLGKTETKIIIDVDAE